MAAVLTDENFEKEISSTDQLVMVDFFAPWCEPCNMLAPALEKVAKDLEGKFAFMKANLDEAPLMAQKFGIEVVPTVVLFKNGKPISGFVGLAYESVIKDWLEKKIKETENIK
ncbi:MAG: thioredoxin [Candidatus Pacebacteria bacterium]|nr:thioredoxin [Candidatus Paceibacterota bacterium]